jgi:hypothetical protein
LRNPEGCAEPARTRVERAPALAGEDLAKGVARARVGVRLRAVLDLEPRLDDVERVEREDGCEAGGRARDRVLPARTRGGGGAAGVGARRGDARAGAAAAARRRGGGGGGGAAARGKVATGERPYHSGSWSLSFFPIAATAGCGAPGGCCA